MSDAAKPTRLDDTTRAIEEEDARVRHQADAMPTPDEEDAAERAGDPDPEVVRNYEDAMERGARQKGEGRLP
jgi:hypothetical protein